MPTEKPRVTFTISEEKLSELEAYRFDNRIKNQSQAILSLIDRGLSALEAEKAVDTKKSPSADSLSAEEQTHIKKYRLLDPYGKEAVDGVLDVEWRRGTDKAVLEMSEPDMVYFVVPGFASPMSAGTGQPVGDGYPENYKLVKEPPRGTSYIARVQGNSMEPSYYDGELVFVHAGEEVSVGQIGVFYMDGQQWIKERGVGELISHNQDYDPRPMTEDIRCQGLVLGVCDDSYF